MSTIADRFTPVRPLGPYLLLVQDRDGTPLVLKRLPDRDLADASAIHHFRQEAWRVAQLEPPRFAKLYVDGTDVREQPYYAMGYAQGPPATLVQPGEVGTCVRQLALALADLHQRGWVHASLEPAHLRRTDVGLVVVGYGNLTPIGQRALRGGLDPYQAPEQAAGERLDGRADLYAIGALIHFWLTGEGHGPVDLLELVADPLAAIGRRLLSRHPADRFSDAVALLAELDRGGIARRPRTRLKEEEPMVAPIPHLIAPCGPRREALAWLERPFADLAEGHGGAVHLQAAGGAGKTTLLAQVAQTARDAGWPVFCLIAHGPNAWPLAPWQGLLATLWPLAAERQSGLAERFRPRLEGLLGPTGVGRSSEGGGSALSDLVRPRWLQALAEFLAALAEPGLVVIADDWDQADLASRQALDWVRRRLGDAPVLWILSGEQAPMGPTPIVQVPPLSVDEVQSLATAILPAPIRPATAQALADAAEGRPWFILTLLGLWRETGEWRIGPAEVTLPEAARWPRDVAALAWQRGSALDATAWTVGGVAAKLGPAIDPAALAIWVTEAEILAEGLDHLLRAGILLREPTCYRFAHPAYAAMYGRVLTSQRALALHGRLFEAALAGDYACDRLEFAMLAIKAERPEQTAALALEVARQVLVLGGCDSARLLVEEGLVTLGADHGARPSYIALLAEIWQQLGDPAQAAVLLKEACTAMAGVPQHPERAATEGALAEILSGLGRHAEALAHWRAAAGQAQVAGNPDLLAGALAGLTNSQSALGAAAEAIASGDAAVGVAGEASALPRALALASLGAVLAMGERERQSEGVALLQRASALFEAEGDRPRLMTTLLALAEAEVARGEVTFARATAGRALALATEDDDAAVAIGAGLLLGWAAYWLGDTGQAKTLAEEARCIAEGAGRAAGAAEALALGGLARCTLGDVEPGLLDCARAAEALGPLASPALAARVWLSQAEALIGVQRYPEAAAALVTAAAPVKEAHRPDLIGRRGYWLGVWAARTGDGDRARSELRAVLAQPSQHLVAAAALQLARLAGEAGARTEAAGWLEQARRGALALGVAPLAREVEQAERAILGDRNVDEDSPRALAERLVVVMAEARALVPRVIESAEALEGVSRRLAEAEALNALWPRLLVAENGADVARELADAIFAATVATRSFVLGRSLQPLAARGRDAGDLPYEPAMVQSDACLEALASGQSVTRVPGGTIRDHAMVVPLLGGRRVLGVLYAVGEAPLSPPALLAIAQAGALALQRLADQK